MPAETLPEPVTALYRMLTRIGVAPYDQATMGAAFELALRIYRAEPAICDDWLGRVDAVRAVGSRYPALPVPAQLRTFAEALIQE